MVRTDDGGKEAPITTPGGPMFTEALRVAIQERLWATGTPQAELARKVGLSPAQITRYLKGDRGLSLEKIDSILEALGLEVEIRPGDRGEK